MAVAAEEAEEVVAAEVEEEMSQVRQGIKIRKMLVNARKRTRDRGRIITAEISARERWHAGDFPDK